MAFSTRFSLGRFSKYAPTQSATNNSFNVLGSLPLDFNDFSNTGLNQEEIGYENIEFNSMNMDDTVIHAKLTTCWSRGKAVCYAPKPRLQRV
jgi:hypothetical protein